MREETKAAIRKQDLLAKLVAVVEKVGVASLSDEERTILSDHVADLRRQLQAAEDWVKKKSTFHYCNQKLVGRRQIGKYEIEARYTTEKDLNGEYWALVEVTETTGNFAGMRLCQNVERMAKQFKTRRPAQSFAEKEYAKLIEKYGKKAKPKSPKQTPKSAPKKSSRRKVSSEAEQLTEKEKAGLRRQNAALNQWGNGVLAGEAKRARK